MYPSGELNRLAARKALVRLRIDGNRWQCAETGAQLMRPVELLDRGLGYWRALSPLVKIAGVPLMLMLTRRLVGRAGRFAGIVRLLPSIFRTVRMFAGRGA